MIRRTAYRSFVLRISEFSKIKMYVVLVPLENAAAMLVHGLDESRQEGEKALRDANFKSTGADGEVKVAASGNS